MTTYYVGAGGNDGNAGTSWATRYLTLNAVDATALSAGDTVYVGPGTYIGNGAGSGVSFTSAGSSGNEITIIGDYTGENTDGVGGLVRITRSADDQTPASDYGFNLGGAYTTVRGFHFDGANTVANLRINGVANCIVEDCTFGENGSAVGLLATGAATAATVRRCLFMGTTGGKAQLQFYDAATYRNDTASVVENCLFVAGYQTNIYCERHGGVTVRNCTFFGGTYALLVYTLDSGQTVTVNNCNMFGQQIALYAETSGFITENYNNITGFSSAARTNVSTGANSTAGMTQFDPRWWHELVSGDGTMLTPFDLASYSVIVERNSGTGAPASDARGNAAGTYREWGPLEYSDDLAVDTRERRPRIMRFG